MADDELPRALRLLWQVPDPPRRSRGLTREAIVAAAIELADSDGLAAVSMARLAERLGCGTMSLYRHVASKDELVTFMVSDGPGPAPKPAAAPGWRAALENWAIGLWEVYHRHPWILQAAPSGPPADPGQLTWLDAGLATLATTTMTERDKLAAVVAVLHFVRGAAALAIDDPDGDDGTFPALLRRLVDAERFPALAAAIAGGAFDGGPDDPYATFRLGLTQLLDGVGVTVAGTGR
ncbi:TetR/AcrR family transcriptional regulator [Mycobacterium sp. NPDC003449]